MAQSGTALDSWAYQRNIKDLSYYLFTLVNGNYSTNRANSSEILDFLRNAPAKAIDDASFNIYLMVSLNLSKKVYTLFF